MSVEADFSGLERMQKMFAQKRSVRVGILSGGRSPDGQSLASIGAKHEYGTLGVPKRSFIRYPLSKHGDELRAAIKEAGQSSFETGNLEKILARIGLKAEVIVKESFNTGGDGTWPPLSPITIEEKGSSQILVDKGFLRDGVTSEVY